MDNRINEIRYIEKNRGLILALEIFFFAVIMEPAYISDTAGVLHSIFRTLKYVDIGIVLFMAVVKRKMNGMLIKIIVLEGLLFLSTIINNPSGMSIFIREAAYPIVLAYFVQVMLEADIELLLRSISLVLGTYIHLNTISFFLYPTGMYVNPTGYATCWFLGYDNLSGIFIILALVVALYRMLAHHTFKLWDFSVIVSAVYFTVARNMAAIIIAEALLGILMIFGLNNWFRDNILKAKYAVISMFALFFILQLLNTPQLNIFSGLFALLGKDSTFTGRTLQWNRAWSLIWENNRWLLGYGVLSKQNFINLFWGKWNLTQLHSNYLQLLFEGGIFAFLTLFIIFYDTSMKYDRVKHSYSTIVWLIGVLSTLIVWQMEAQSRLMQYIFILLVMMYNTPLLEKYAERTKEPRIRFILHCSRNQL